MALKKIEISNFKSFNHIEINLENLNVLIGANSSGKSNFIQIFKFLRDISEQGLDNAISKQGGTQLLRNINIGRNENFSVEVVYDPEFPAEEEKHKKMLIGVKVYEVKYHFTLKFKKRGPGFEIVEDQLIGRVKYIRLEKQKKKVEERESIGNGEFVFSRVKGKVKPNFDNLNLPEGINLAKEKILPQLFKMLNKVIKSSSKNLLLEFPPFTMMHLFIIPPIFRTFREMGVYDINTKEPKKPTLIIVAGLKEDGSNLAIVLKNLIENREKYKRFSNLIKDLLPFVDKVGIKELEDKSLFFKLREVYAKKSDFLSSFISDGTINIIALILALYFEKNKLTIIEEPEKNIHPSLISKVVDMMKDVSRNKQLIITTHNPEVVKHVDPESLLLVSRDDEGFSTITRPTNKDEIRTFLKNEIGLDELFVQNLFET